MGKCVFEEYDITLHGKNYKVLVPGTKITEMWVEMWGEHYKNTGWNYVMADRTALKWIRNAYLKLWENPYHIIYFPVRDVEKVMHHQYAQLPPELVFYTHQLQLKRKEWKKIKRCMKYMKPKIHVFRYDMPKLLKECDQMMHNWKKKHSFYRYAGRKYRDDEKIFYQYETCFVESSVRQALYTAMEIQKALEENLEKELEDSQYLQYTAGNRCGGGLSYEFATKEFLKRREAEEWR